jgi:hypothetical protein
MDSGPSSTRLDLPAHFASVVSQQGLTVQVTPSSPRSLGLAVAEKSTSRIVVRELRGGRGDYDFDWEVKSIRVRGESMRVNAEFARVERSLATPPPRGGSAHRSASAIDNRRPVSGPLTRLSLASSPESITLFEKSADFQGLSRRPVY